MATHRPADKDILDFLDRGLDARGDVSGNVVLCLLMLALNGAAGFLWKPAALLGALSLTSVGVRVCAARRHHARRDLPDGLCFLSCSCSLLAVCIALLFRATERAMPLALLTVALHAANIAGSVLWIRGRIQRGCYAGGAQGRGNALGMLGAALGYATAPVLLRLAGAAARYVVPFALSLLLGLLFSLGAAGMFLRYHYFLKLGRRYGLQA